MPPLLTSADYPAIRAALDISLDATDLPDSLIDLDQFVGKGVREVLQRDSLAESRSGTELLRARNAAIFFTAALLAPSVPAITSESEGTYRVNREAWDGQRRQRELRALADDELNAYLTPGARSPARVTLLRAAPGGRGA